MDNFIGLVILNQESNVYITEDAKLNSFLNDSSLPLAVGYSELIEILYLFND